MKRLQHSVPMLILSLALVFLALAGSIATTYLAVERARTQAFDRAKETAAGQAEALRATVDGRFATLEAYASSFMSNIAFDFNAVATLRRLGGATSGDYFFDMVLISPDGIAHGQDGSTRDVSDRAFVAKSMAAERCVEFTADGEDEPCLTLSVPLLRREGVMGVLAGTFSVETFRKILVSEFYTGSGYSFLADSTGGVIIDAEASDKINPGGNILKTLELDDQELEALATALHSGQAGHITYTPAGENHYAVYVPTDINDWVLFNVIPGAQIDQEVYNSTWGNYTILAIVAVLSLVLVSYNVFTYRRRSRQLETDMKDLRTAVLHSGRNMMRYNPATDTAEVLGERADIFTNTDRIEHYTQVMLASGLILPDSWEEFSAFHQKMRQGQSSGSSELHVRGEAGEERWMHADFTLVCDGEDHSRHALLSFYDNTQQKERELRYERWQREVAAQIADSVFYLEANLTQDLVERTLGERPRNAADQGGGSLSDQLQADLSGWVYPDDAATYGEFFSRKRLLSLYAMDVFEDSAQFRLRLGQASVWCRVTVQMMRYPDKEDIQLTALYKNIDAEQREKERLSQMANQDFLTGILNRSALERSIRDALAGAGETDLSALFMIDLDNFKECNDTLGHQAGDQILQDVATAITGVFRQGDLLGRIGGDEFVAFLTGRVNRELIERKASLLLEALQFSRGGMSLTASVGVALCRGGEASFEQLYAAADQALYQVKRTGKHSTCFADDVTGQSEKTSVAVSQSETVQYKTLLEYMQGGVLLADVGDTVQVTYASPSVYRSTMHTVEELGIHGEKALNLVWPEDLPALLEAVHKTAKTGQITDVTYRVGADGQAWRHLRIAPLAKKPDGVVSVIGAISDMTEFKRFEEELKLSEERYRIADELSHAMIWEVDIPNRTLYQSLETSRALGHERSVYRNVPDALLATGTIHPTSVEDFCRMYDDLYAGDDSKEYTILSQDGTGGYVWLRAAFRIQRDSWGQCVRSVGIVEKVPSVDADMRIFEDELRFADAVAPAILGTVQANLGRNTVEKYTLNRLAPAGSYDAFLQDNLKNVHPEDREQFLQTMDRQHLLKTFDSGSGWLFVEYRRGTDGDWQWTNLAVNLLRHPVSRDVFAFSYHRNIQSRRRWTEALDSPPQRDADTSLYTRAAMASLSAIAAGLQPQEATCAMTVFELLAFERLRARNGAQSAQRLLFTVARLCCATVDGDVLIGCPAEGQFAIFRADAGTAEQHRSRILQYQKRARSLLRQTMEAEEYGGLDLCCGFTLCTSRDFQFDEALRRATLACTIDREQPGSQVAQYQDPADALYGWDGAPASLVPAAKRRVLIADDEPVSRTILRRILEEQYAVEEAADGEDALEQLSQGGIALLICDILMPRLDGWAVLEAMQSKKLLLQVPVIMLTADGTAESEIRALQLGASDVIVKPIVAQTLMSRVRNLIGRREALQMAERNSLYELRFQQQAEMLRQTEYDELTGLLGKQGFYRRVRQQLVSRPEIRYRLPLWDLDNFKLVNEALGVEAGDRLLIQLGSAISEAFGDESICARLESDHFIGLVPDTGPTDEEILARMNDCLATCGYNLRLAAHMGVYPIDEPALEISVMCDRALLALKAVKGSYAKRIAYYNDSLRDTLLEEQALSGEMATALENREFVLYFQPQVNYEDGTLIGAEALVRWQHPTKGLISPGVFIPLFEHNGFITTLDKYIWEESCRYMRRWLDQEGKLLPVSVSVNISRVDIYNPDLCQDLQNLVKKYNLPPENLRLEITESAYMQNPEQLIAVVKALRQAGFTVEMDDFGAGYSSLNTLKDVPVNVLKLDIRFLSKGEDDVRGGNILSSVIRMAHWLDLPVIAEGVETRTQAEYLKSMNCYFMQGYYFGRPMPAEEFEQLLRVSQVGQTSRYGSANLEGVAAFWDPSEQMALVFNSFVGGAAILEYQGGRLEVLRANDNFYRELRSTRSAYTAAQKNCLAQFDEENRALLVRALEEAIHTGAEAECQVRWQRPGGDVWVRGRLRMLARNADGYLLYIAMENITRRKELEREAGFTAQLREALDLNPACIYVMEPESHRMLYGNQALQACFGTAVEGSLCYETLLGQTEPCLHCPVNHCTDKTKPRLVEKTSRDGLRLITQAAPIRWAGQDMYIITCMALDALPEAEQDP